MFYSSTCDGWRDCFPLPTTAKKTTDKRGVCLPVYENIFENYIQEQDCYIIRNI